MFKSDKKRPLSLYFVFYLNLFDYKLKNKLNEMKLICKLLCIKILLKISLKFENIEKKCFLNLNKVESFHELNIYLIRCQLKLEFGI